MSVWSNVHARTASKRKIKDAKTRTRRRSLNLFRHEPMGPPITQTLEINAGSSDVIFITIFWLSGPVWRCLRRPAAWHTLEVFRKQQSPLGTHSGVAFLGGGRTDVRVLTDG